MLEGDVIYKLSNLKKKKKSREIIHPINEIFKGTETFHNMSAQDVLSNLGGFKIFIPLLLHLINNQQHKHDYA